MAVATKLFSGGQEPAVAQAPLPPAASTENTSASVQSQAQASPGRDSTVAAGNDPSLSDSTDPYSVRKKLLGT